MANSFLMLCRSQGRANFLFCRGHNSRHRGLNIVFPLHKCSTVVSIHFWDENPCLVWKGFAKNLSEAYIRMHTCMTSAWMSLRPSSVCLCHVFRIQTPLSVIYPRLSLISFWEQTGVSRKNVPASPEKSHRMLRPQIQLPFHRHWSSLRICLAAWGFTSWWHNKNKDSLVPYVSKRHERLDYVHNSWMS